MHAAQFICVWLRKENHVALKLHLQHLQLCGRNDMRINRMLGCWVVGLLGCWVVGLLGCWVVGLLGRWVVGLLGCWVVGLLGCWVVGLFIY